MALRYRNRIEAENALLVNNAKLKNGVITVDWKKVINKDEVKYALSYLRTFWKYNVIHINKNKNEI